MRKKHTFLESINRAREASSARPQSSEKPLSELSEQELDTELQKAQQRLSEAKRREVAATREAAEATGNRPGRLFQRSNRRPWK